MSTLSFSLSDEDTRMLQESGIAAGEFTFGLSTAAMFGVWHPDVVALISRYFEVLPGPFVRSDSAGACVLRVGSDTPWLGDLDRLDSLHTFLLFQARQPRVGDVLLVSNVAKDDRRRFGLAIVSRLDDEDNVKWIRSSQWHVHNVGHFWQLGVVTTVGRIDPATFMPATTTPYLIKSTSRRPHRIYATCSESG